jgi:hypothetical protein
MYSQIMTLTQENRCGCGIKDIWHEIGSPKCRICAQLEWLKPSLMGGQRGGFYAGPAVMDLPGTT